MAAPNNGAEKLITSILDEAQQRAEAIEAAAQDTAADIKRKLEEDRELLREEFAKKADALREETMARARTNSELAARKDLLLRKRGLIDEAYSNAFKAVCSLEGEKREALLKRLLERECEGGEKVCPAEKDRAALNKLIASLEDLRLTLGECEPSITDGFVLKGGNFVKDCSFSALMEEVRNETSGSVVGMLFK